jgi:signal transduction histidine kinase
MRHTLKPMTVLSSTPLPSSALEIAGEITKPAQPIWRKLARHGLIALIFNTGIAVVLTIVGSQPFANNWTYSQLIGLSIWLLIDGLRHVFHPQGHISAKVAAVLTVSGGLCGYFFGSSMGDLILGHPVMSGWRHAPNAMAGYLLMSLFAAGLGVYFFMTREILAVERSKLELAQRQAAQAQLKLLQSQLDPHMLFNTLANLRVLITQDAPRAVQMLDQLNDFLRATLKASRTTEHSLQAEFDRLRDYLSLMQIRMGPRLRFALDLPAELAQHHVPALILQSVVENAIVHGLEPKVQGGQIHISARQESAKPDGAMLVLQVQDDGLGCEPSQLQEGFGLAQVRERLRSYYGEHATINLIANSADFMPTNSHFSFQKGSAEATAGCQVTLRMPLSDTPS